MRRAGWLLAAPFALLSIASAHAADPGANAWVVTDVHGAVLALVGGQWREVSSGDRIGDGIAVRTLQAGSVKLRRGGEEIGLAANTVVRPTAADGGPTVEQYSGVVTLAEPKGGAARPVTRRADGAAPPAALYVRGGKAYLSVGGRQVLLKAGQGYSAPGNGDGPIGSAAGGAGAPAPAATATQGAATGDAPSSPEAAGDNGGAPGNANQTGAAGSPATTDNGAGNAGTPGSGGQTGNGNGTAANGGQSSTGNAGGNGNSGKGQR